MRAGGFRGGDRWWVVCVDLSERSLTAGYQNTLSASVIANKGFIAQFKDPGAKKLNPSHVSTFGGLFR